MFMTKIFPTKETHIPTNVETTATNDILIRRTTNRYGLKGSWHSNKGYMKVGRGKDGVFVSVKGV
jgi:hypothetical protein